MKEMTTQSIIFSSWLQGYNLEDIELLSKQDFPGSETLFQSFLDLYKSNEPITPQSTSRHSGVSLKELALILPDYSRAFYEGAILELQSAALKKLVLSGASPEKIGQAAQRFKYGKSTLAPPKDLFSLFADELDRRGTRILTRYGFPRLDKYTGGIQPGQLITVAARPSGGKSALALQITKQVAAQGKDILFFSLEMSTGEILERLICSGTTIPQEELKSGSLSEASWQKYAVFGDKISQLEKHLLLFTPYECGTITLEHIAAEVQKRKPFLVVIDQISLLRTAQKFNLTWERYTYITNQLKNLAMAEGVAIILLAQLNRSAQDKEEPTMASLKNSGSLEEDSDVLLIISRPDPDSKSRPDSDSPKTSDIKLAKNRNGRTGDFRFDFNGEKYHFTEL